MTVNNGYQPKKKGDGTPPAPPTSGSNIQKAVFLTFEKIIIEGTGKEIKVDAVKRENISFETLTKKYPIVEKLKDENIVIFQYRDGYGRLEVIENCDGVYGVDLDKNEIKELVDFLNEFIKIFLGE